MEYPFVIKDLRLNEYAGVTRIYDLNNELKILKIGHTWIGERFQGTGLNKNCKYLLFEFLFDELKIERIGFGASSENIKSINAMKGIGCKQEGILRSFMPGINGKDRVDIVLMSILKNEWTSKIKEDLKRKI
ncbi:GNAT family protein [Flavobacteriaceae bacterium KMM 6898]|nr:GNAT family protein [Flavobacteriaceae bacterium KMM 6898]